MNPSKNTTSPLVTLAIDSDGIAHLHLNDIAGKNAMSEAFTRALIQQAETLAASDPVKCVVITGTPEIFCSGASEELLQGILKGTLTPFELTLPRTLLGIPVPVISAIEGHVLAGGLCIPASSDIVVLAKEARVGATFMNMGFTPGVGLTRLLEHWVSPMIAHEMLLTGQLFKGAHLEHRSHTNYVLPRAQVRDKAFEIASRLSEKPRQALELLKKTLVAPRKTAFEKAREQEIAMHEVTFQSAETAALIRDYFESLKSG